MQNRDHINEELKLAGGDLLSSLSGQMPYTVPSGYFGHLAAQVNDFITISESADPQPQWSRGMPYHIPAAYFDTLPMIITARSQSEDTVPGGLSQDNPFAVPAGYFEQFSANILSRVKEEEQEAVPAPVVKNRRIPLFRTMQLAASVVFILFAGLGILRINDSIAPLTGPVAAVDFNSVSKEAINEYVMQNIDDFDTDLIVSSLSSTDPALDAAMGTSNEEIQAYLNEDGWN